MKKLIFILLFLFSQTLFAIESLNLEIKSDHSLLKQGDAGLFTFVFSGENLNPSEIRNLFLQKNLIKGILVSSIKTEDVGMNEISYKALAAFYEKDLPASTAAKVNNKEYQIKIKYLSLAELTDKKSELQILNQRLPWRILLWASLILLVILIVVGFINRKEIHAKLNAKKIAKLKKELLRFQNKVSHATTVEELDKLKLEIKKYNILGVEKNLNDELVEAKTKTELEKIYQKRKEIYVFNLFSKKQLSDFESKMNKIQYRPKWENDDINEIINLIKIKKGDR